MMLLHLHNSIFCFYYSCNKWEINLHLCCARRGAWWLTSCSFMCWMCSVGLASVMASQVNIFSTPSLMLASFSSPKFNRRNNTPNRPERKIKYLSALKWDSKWIFVTLDVGWGCYSEYSWGKITNQVVVKANIRNIKQTHVYIVRYLCIVHRIHENEWLSAIQRTRG